MRLAAILALLAMLFGNVAACAQIDSETAPRIGFHDLNDARMSGATHVIAADAGMSGDLTVRVTIDTQGRVTEAHPIDNYRKVDPAPGLAAIRQWRFRPQTFEGRPVMAVGPVRIDYDAPERPADASVPLPDAAVADTEITLTRGACFGSCPAYTVTIRGDGRVRFTTGDDALKGTASEVHEMYNGTNVLLPGTHEARVDPRDVAALIERFREAHFFGLKPEYSAMITDAPTQVITLRRGTARKQVMDYVGREVGMPAAVTALEQAVDALAGSARWTTGSPATIAWLTGTGFDFRSSEAARLTRRAADFSILGGSDKSSAGFIRAMIERGVPLDALDTPRRGTPTSLGATLLLGAAGRGDEPLVTLLAAKGYLAHIPPAALTAVFAGGAGCSPMIARALVKAGADPKATGGSGYMNDGTALTRIRTYVCDQAGEARQTEMARTLIELGVPIEARDSLDWTPLMGVESPALARLLLAHGADPNARTKDGTTPVLATDDDRVALLLLRAGADPRARNDRGSVRDQASKGGMPATLAWLDEHAVR